MSFIIKCEVNAGPCYYAKPDYEYNFTGFRDRAARFETRKDAEHVACLLKKEKLVIDTEIVAE